MAAAFLAAALLAAALPVNDIIRKHRTITLQLDWVNMNFSCWGFDTAPL